MSGLKIVQSSGKSVEFKECEGLFSCLMEHEVTKTKADFKWTGPKITCQTWAEVLAFFKWTYDTEKSEAQVRLFVHPTLGWLAWAFPQQGGTGMTSKELETEEFTKQRAEKIPAGYMAFGTVHHHCGCSAFQSGTDETDERKQDGLHITIGNMDKPRYDIHARFYFKGHKFDVGMDSFWDVGGQVVAKKQELEQFFGCTIELDTAARSQMCAPAPSDAAFPEDWKANYLVKKYSPVTTVGDTWVSGTTWCSHCMKYVKKCEHTQYAPHPSYRGKGWHSDAKEVLSDIVKQAVLDGRDEESVHSAILFLSSEHEDAKMVRAIFAELDTANYVDIDDLSDLIIKDETESEKIEKQEVADSDDLYGTMCQ